MFNAIVVTNDDLIKEESARIISETGAIQVDFLSNFQQFKVDDYNLDYLFILLSDFNSGLHDKLGYIKNYLPQTPVIFYNHSLTIENIGDVPESANVHMIVGERRKQDLHELLRTLKENHWRHIPLEEFGIERKKLSPRIIKAISYIENSEMQLCNTINIAKHLDISPGYFSQEFKRATGISFRSFMQKVLNYYEETILVKGNLSTKAISHILGYSELSSFSRSFKRRKGLPPTQFRRKMQASQV